MKTFETEKHNIPEGATHYFDETSEEHFAWWNDSKQMLLDPENANEWVAPNEYDEVSNPIEIPQISIETPEERGVEWVNGDIATYEGKQALVIAYHPHHPSVVIELPDNEYLNVLASELSKPETEAERVEREREDSAKDLYTTYMSKWEFSQDWEALDEINKSAFLAIVDKTNYRKESE